MNEGRILLGEQEVAPWRALHAQLKNTTKLAGVFRGWVPKGYEHQGSRILYVGKATSGPYADDEPESLYFNGSHAFWDFARQVAKEIGCSEERLECIAWSNISKVALPQVAADASLLRGFEDIAASTLEKEIRLTKCNVLVFVTKQFGEDVVAAIGQTGRHEDWNKSETESSDSRVRDIWWRRRTDGVAVLWMRHPMGASMPLRNYAASKIAYLASEQS